MAGPKLFDRVKDTSTTTGTGTLTLANSAPTGFRTFGSVLSDADTCFYAIATSGSAEWEVGIGTYTASGTTLARTTVLASSNSNNAVNLSSGTKDVFMPTPAQVQNYLYNPTNTVANLAAYMAGRVLFPSNGFSLYRDTGSALAPWGPAFPFTPPVDGDFAWVNQGSATVSTTNGGIYLSCVSNGGSQNSRIRKKAAPSTPYTITAAFLLQFSFSGYASGGLCFRQSSDGKVVIMHADLNAAGAGTTVLLIRNFDSPSSVSSTPSSPNVPLLGSVIWQRIADNGTNRIMSVSADGQNWIDVYTVGRTTFMTADEVGFAINPFSSDTGLTLLSWKEG